MRKKGRIRKSFGFSKSWELFMNILTLAAVTLGTLLGVAEQFIILYNIFTLVRKVFK